MLFLKTWVKAEVQIVLSKRKYMGCQVSYWYKNWFKQKTDFALRIPTMAYSHSQAYSPQSKAFKCENHVTKSQGCVIIKGYLTKEFYYYY